MFNITDDILKVIFSNVKKDSKYIKANIKKIIISSNEVYQLTCFTQKQVFHFNLDANNLLTEMERLMNENFNQCEVYTKNTIYGYKLTSKGKILTNVRKNTENIEIGTNNIQKQYLINEGEIIPPLIDLKVMTPDGKIVKAYYDKFKQINKFLELINDTIGDEKKLNIIDFGCGKSYLTFIVYYFLTVIKKIDANIIGLDLKEDVIEKCNEIKDKYGYKNLSFLVGDISLYKPKENVDMIITLHACDTATDYALYHAIKLKCKYILSAPCCQHEINSQMKSDKFNLINKYGLEKEKFSTLLTDSIRANILEYFGYKVNVCEFIDISHSPKNVMLKAVLNNSTLKDEIKIQIEETLNYFNVHHTLFDLFFKKS